MQKILFTQSMTWRENNCVKCEVDVDSSKWILTLKDAEERCRRKYKNCIWWLMSLPFLILRHEKSSCSSWTVFDTVHLFLLKTSQYISVFLPLLQWPIVQFTYVLHDAGQTSPSPPRTTQRLGGWVWARFIWLRRAKNKSYSTGGESSICRRCEYTHVKEI